MNLKWADIVPSSKIEVIIVVYHDHGVCVFFDNTLSLNVFAGAVCRGVQKNLFHLGIFLIKNAVIIVLLILLSHIIVGSFQFFIVRNQKESVKVG